MRLQGKVAIVTGAARAFGEGIARRFAAEGATLVVAELNRDGAQALAEELDAVAVGEDAESGRGCTRSSPPRPRPMAGWMWW